MPASPSTDSLLQLRQLACVRGERMLFRGLDLCLAPGALVLVRGPNGCGKSSLLRQCGGLLRAHFGSVTRSGGAALCDDRLPFDLDQPLAGALNFWHRLYGGAGQNVAAVMAMLDLDRLADVPLGYCSTGQRQRARLARLALSGAPLWLLDEPANGLDSAAVAAMAALVTDHRSRGGAALLTSHIDLPLSPDMVVNLPDYAP